MKTLEIIPQSTDYSKEGLEELVGLRNQLLDDGFSDCTVSVPTQSWQGTRVDAFVDLDTDPPLPCIIRSPDYDRLVVSTLSGIALNVALGKKGQQVWEYQRAALGKMVMDTEIKDAIYKIAELAEDLARQGYGYSGEHDWLEPMAAVDGPIVIRSSNSVRYYRRKHELEEQLGERRAFWKGLGWTYSPSAAYEDQPAVVGVFRYTDYDPDENAINDCLQFIDCNEDLEVSGRLSPDWGPACAINPLGPLTLDELAQLQAHAKEEFTTGCLSEAYARLKQ